jgi:hypothetical protein
MPAIRDISWNYTTSTTGTTIAIDLPNYEVNDLLIVVITADTYDATGGFTANATSQGWTLIHQTVNTALQFMAYKIAGTEPISYTFTSTDSETYNGCIISVQDVNTTNPFGNPAVRTTANQAAAAKYQMSTITTNVANSLILYVVSNSATGVPSLIEGPVYGLLGADGNSESTGVGWGFQAATGTTPNNVTCSNVTTGAGVKTTLQIAPPATGATVIPAYTAADASTYLDPLNGTTAFNGNTAFAATADTNFGTSFTTPIGTITGVDGTVSAVIDTGLNSFHSTAQITSASTVNMAGAELVFATANRPNVTGKNVLVHAQIATSGTLQRLGSIPSRRGVWFGMRSGTSVYKVFQVLGADSPNSAGRPVPLIINDTATSTIASAGTLNPAAILAMGIWNSGKTVGTSVVQYASMWLMDKTTICGGTSTLPVNIPGIAEAAAKGHERVSVIQQGASQMLCLQHLQFGDGTKPIYLNLDSTAIEFPSQYNIDTKQVSYHAPDNKIGLTYLAAATDTIIHTNSVVSSQSKYFWEISASSSASATYDFNGLTLVNALVTLQPVTTFSGMTFIQFQNISALGCSVVDSKFELPPATSDSLDVNTSSTFSNCTFETGSITAGNYLTSVADPSIFTDCTFIGSGTSGHAIRITTPGTYSFSGNTFTGYGGTGGDNLTPNSGSTSAAIFNNSGGLVTINISGGTSPSVRNGAGATTDIVASALLTFEGLQTGSEVRVYVGTDPATSTEIGGVESSGTTFEFSQGYPGQAGYYTILALGYVPIYQAITFSGSDQKITVVQAVDRTYTNP